MLEEDQTGQNPRLDPNVNSHRPSSGKSQDISHVLASNFKDLYTKDIIGRDTLSNLLKTKKGRSSYYEKYVEELQQAHAEYSRCIKEADMLENHIIQARARAAATERHASDRIKEETGDYDDHGLLPVKSAFSYCVDNNLLSTNNLICPQDYLPTEKPRVKAPVAKKSNPAKPTIAYTMRVSQEPQDDGYTLIPSSEKDINASELSLTFDFSSDSLQNKETPKKRSEVKPKPKWKDEPSAEDKAEGLRKLQKMKDRLSFLRNPRLVPPNAQRGAASLIQPRTNVVRTKQEARGMEDQSSSNDDPVPVFIAKPSVVVFADYSVGHVYETTLELKNVTSSSRHVRVIPPTTPYFSVGLGRFPGEGGIIAPGMSCKYTVRFAPDSLSDYDDFIVVETQAEHLFAVSVLARRPPPVLSLPRVLDCGYCLIGGVKFVEFVCQNVGLSSGTFCIIPKNQWPASNFRSLTRTFFSEQPPFAISPSLFELQPGEETVVEVVFFPTTSEKSCQVFTIVCDNCQVKDFSIEGEGQRIALELVSGSDERQPPVAGELHDLTAEHYVSFNTCNRYAVQEKTIVIRNNVHLELPFHWYIMKPNLHPLLPGETPNPSHIHFHLSTDGVFSVRPLKGLLAPCQDHEFLITYCPKELKDYHSVCHLVLMDVPLLQETNESSGLQPVSAGSRVSDVIVMEIEVKGSTEPYQVVLDPYAVLIPGDTLICTTIRRQFKMWNHSKTFINFQWERMDSNSHLIEVEPSCGRIDVNECFDLDLLVTGGKPERVVTSLICHVEHHHEAVTLAVEVSFKGPVVTLNVPIVDFGLMRLGALTQTTLLLTNTTQLEATWTMEERLDGGRDHEDTQISVEPCRGVLPPLASCSVNLLFKPRFCEQRESELELKVENGTGCHLSVRADVQSPQVCLLSCQLLLSELYIGIPAKSSITLFNQTLLPSHFRWMAQLQGEQASLCSGSFDPSSGTLGPNASMEIIVTFTSHTDLEITKVTALCEVQGMDSPLILCILASKPKKLSVSYSLPSVCSAPDVESPSMLVLNFGDVVLKRAVTKQLLITNQTAVPAAFSIEAEYFTCHPSKPDNQSEKRSTYVKKPLHSVHAKKIEEKAHQEFVSSLLAHGKGAAFFVLPNTGSLGPYEVLTVDVTAYTDMWGKYSDRLVCKVGDLEPTLISMQMTVRGCPLYFQMTGPQPKDQNQGPTIQFGTHLSGGDTVSRLIRINNPTMHNIRMDWETYNKDQNDHKLVDVVVVYGDAFPVKDADGNTTMSGVLQPSDGNIQTTWGRNQTPCSEGTSASPQSVTNGEEEGCVAEDEQTCLHPSPVGQKLFSVHVRPHMGNLSDYPYCITPQQIVIPAQSSGTIHVSFTPLTLSMSDCESRCVGLALGFMSLDSKLAAGLPGKVKRAQGLDLEPVRVDLLAAVKNPVLLVQMEEDDNVLKFHASAGDLLRAESIGEVVVQEFDIVRTLQLHNTSGMALQFRLGTLPPFVVLKPRPRAPNSASSILPAGDSQALLLQPQRTMQVKVAFHCSLSLLEHEESGEEATLGVMEVRSASGQKKLRFQQNLLIHFSNNSLQTVPLQAHLDLVTLGLSSDSINFGFCYVGQTQTAEVNLYSHGSHTSWKSSLESDDGGSDVFRVTPDSGFLKLKELSVGSCSESLQITFTPSEDREFRATVVIHSPVEKTPVTLQLQGTGSFDEKYK